MRPVGFLGVIAAIVLGSVILGLRFGLFKKSKPLALTTGAGNLLDMLSPIRTSVDRLARSAGIDQAPHYDIEVSGFVYILGWYAIQQSLSSSDRHRFSAELQGVFAKKMASESSEEQIGQMLRLLEEREDFYIRALKRGKRRDGMETLITQFMHFLGFDSETNVGLYMALYAAVPQHVSVLQGFLRGLSKTYTFV